MKSIKRNTFLLLITPLVLLAAEALTNDDVVKLSKAGMSETFILDLVQQKAVQFSTDVGRLVDLKKQGVNERIIQAMVKKSPPAESLTSGGVARLVEAGFSEDFVLDQVRNSTGRFSTDTSRIVELKRAGVSERVLAAMVDRSGGSELPAGTPIVVRLIDGIDSEKNKAGDEFRASLDEPLKINGETVAPRGADAALRLSAEKESGKLTGRTELTVELVSVTLRGKPVRLESDEFTKESGSRGNQTAKRAAILGGIGALIGGIAGGGKGAAIGAGAGGAAGVGTQVVTKGQKVKIPSETVLTFRTSDPVRF